jgi:hypothetical protein
MDQILLEASAKLAASVGGAIVARPLLERLLGPSVDYVGKSMSALLERCGNKNIADIFRSAASKISDVPADNHYVNPRVLRILLEDGCYADDVVTREYFAGLLASSISPDGKDDHAITFLVILRSLTTHQVRWHHILYSCLRLLGGGNGLIPFSDGARQIFLPDALLTEHDIPVGAASKAHAIIGLLREGLIGVSYELKHHAMIGDTPRDGTVIGGSPLGAQLFLWVHGHPEADFDSLFDKTLDLVGWEPPAQTTSMTETQLQTAATVATLIQTALAHPNSPVFRDTVKKISYLIKDLPTPAREILIQLPSPKRYDKNPVAERLLKSAYDALTLDDTLPRYA